MQSAAYRLEPVGPPGHERHRVAPGGEGAGQRGADARRRAGDEDRPATLRSTHLPNLPWPRRLLSAAPLRRRERGFLGVSEGSRTPDLQDHNLAL